MSGTILVGTGGKSEVMQTAEAAYFGPAATGVENASRHLFQKGADALSPQEAALLAGLLRAPSIFSPFKNPEKALQRRNKVLEAMAAQGKLSAIELATAVARPLIIRALGNTEEKALPHGVLEALAADESEYCEAFEEDFKKGAQREYPVFWCKTTTRDFAAWPVVRSSYSSCKETVNSIRPWERTERSGRWLKSKS